MSIAIHKGEFPEGFDDYAWESEAKGWLPGAIAIINQRRYSVIFYDPARLAQDIEEEFKAGVAFFEPNLVIVPAVTRTHMEAAIDVIAKTGRYVDLVPEGKPDIPR